LAGSLFRNDRHDELATRFTAVDARTHGEVSFVARQSAFNVPLTNGLPRALG
jgi:hypothetical protein